MKARIMKCKSCRIYTMQTKCKICGKETVEAMPPRFSPQDRYGDYRRKRKLSIFMESGEL